jgi:hypothetical protein
MNTVEVIESDPKVITEQHERFFLAALRHLSKFDEGKAVHRAYDTVPRSSAVARS